MTSTPNVDTTSQNVATNTPQTIATKRGLETAMIVLCVGVVVSVLESVLPLFANSAGGINWQLVGTTATTAAVSALVKALTAYNAANANVTYNASPMKPPRTKTTKTKK